MNWRRLFQPHVLVTAAVVLAGSMTYNSVSPPANMLSAMEDDGLSVVGGQMIIKYHAIRRRYCRNSVTRWLFNPDFEVDGQRETLWIALDSGAAPPVDRGDQHYALALTIPLTVRPGTYHYTATTDYSCGLFSWLEPATERTPDMTVQLVRPDAETPPQIVVAPGAVTVVPGAKP